MPNNKYPELRLLQKCELYIALEIDRVCRKHGIKYSLIDGSLLGAIRHQGFIPWDDDLDVAMLREDYNKFLTVSEKELSSEFFLQTTKTDDKYGLGFAKVQLVNTVFAEYNSKNSGARNGIYVDVFPLDHMPRNIGLQKKASRRIKLLKALLMCKSNYKYAGRDIWYQKALFQLCGIITRIMPKQWIISQLNKETTRYNNEKTTCVINMYSSYAFGKEALEEIWLNDLKEYNFENEKLFGIAEADQFLSRVYGNYMELPPENMRYNRHNALEISFGDFYEKHHTENV